MAKRKTRKKQTQLDSNKVSFVCKYCQRIYYQEDIKDFEEDPKRHEKRARYAYEYNHSCPVKNRIAKKKSTPRTTERKFAKVER